MGKKNKKIKKVKKVKVLKTQEQRSKECKLMKDKITSLGLSEEHIGIPELFKAINEFEKDGYSNSGKIKLRGLKRVASFILTNNPRTESSLQLIFNPDV